MATQRAGQRQQHIARELDHQHGDPDHAQMVGVFAPERLARGEAVEQLAQPPDDHERRRRWRRRRSASAGTTTGQVPPPGIVVGDVKVAAIADAIGRRRPSSRAGSIDAVGDQRQQHAVAEGGRAPGTTAQNQSTHPGDRQSRPGRTMRSEPLPRAFIAASEPLPSADPSPSLLINDIDRRPLPSNKCCNHAPPDRPPGRRQPQCRKSPRDRRAAGPARGRGGFGRLARPARAGGDRDRPSPATPR